MDTQLLQMIANSSGAALVSGMFLWYLVRRDKEFSKSIEDIKSTFISHSKADIAIQTKLAEGLNKLTKVIDSSILYNKKIEKRNLK